MNFATSQMAAGKSSMSSFTVPRQAAGLIGWLGASYLTSAVGAVASINAATFYAEVVRPDWAPPGWLFGPVWITLYTLMGIAAWLVWREAGFRAARTALTLFLVQLVLNAAWSWFFFSWRLGLAAFVDIIILWIMIAAMLVAFWRKSRAAGALIVPYLLWVSFAAVLNFTVWQLNPQLLG